MCALVVTHDLLLVKDFNLKSLSYAKIDANEGQFVISDDSLSSGDNHDL